MEHFLIAWRAVKDEGMRSHEDMNSGGGVGRAGGGEWQGRGFEMLSVG